MDKLKILGKLDLSGCQLEAIPDIRNLTKLETMNLNGNNIDTFDTIENSSVKEIDLQDNHIPGFDLNRESLPSLKCLKIGSSGTKYLSLRLLDELRQETLKVVVAKQHIDSLVFPSAECLGNKKCIEEFVEKASLDLTSASCKERKEVLQWVLQRCGSVLKSFKNTRFRRIRYSVQFRHAYNCSEGNIGTRTT